MSFLNFLDKLQLLRNIPKSHMSSYTVILKTRGFATNNKINNTGNGFEWVLYKIRCLYEPKIRLKNHWPLEKMQIKTTIRFI